MSSRRWFGCLQVIIVLCGGLTHAATEKAATEKATVTSGVTSSPVYEKSVGSASTPAPVDPSSVGTTDTTPLNPTLDSTVTTVDSMTTTADPLASTVDSMATTVNPLVTTPESMATTVLIPQAPTVVTSQPVVTSEACLCDLTPGFCDIGCCCDTVDCDVANLSTVFTGCPQKAISGVCIEKWLMFRANVDSSLITVTDALFCVGSKDIAPQTLPALPQFQALGDSYHFSPPAATTSSHSRAFYRVDDVIQTYFSNSSVRGLLRQPSPGVASAFCFNRNPAKFLRSVSLSCTRLLTPQSCTTDPTLNARSYFSDLSLVKIPVPQTEQVLDLLVPVTPLSDWPEPREQNKSCVNVVKKVEYVIGYTGRGELMYATVNIVLTDVDLSQFLSQTHSVKFQLATASPTGEAARPAGGFRAGSSISARFDEAVKPLSAMGVSESGECSSDSSRQAPVLFRQNSITGCTFSSSAGNCSELRSQIYRILRGSASPDLIAMNSGAEPNWTRVITEECPVSLQETCESGCVLPNTLSIQVLWARQGLLAIPQSYILGAKYLFKCQKFKCPLTSSIALTSEVMFADTTIYPEPPRGSPQPHWKFPFGFFTRGTAELDGHLIMNSSNSEKVTWRLMLFTVMLLTGLDFCIR